MEKEPEYAALQTELAGVQSKVNTWAATRENEMQSMKTSHTTFLDSHAALTQQLKTREKQIKSKAEKNALEVNKHSEALSNVDAENEDLQNSLQQIPQELSELQQQLEHEKENMLRTQHGLHYSDHAWQHTRTQLESGHDLYEKYLGLRLERQIKGALVFKMHNVDPKDPKRQFSFEIRINDETEQYSVTDCIPPVDGLTDMVKKLNETNSLTSFVRGVRKQWRKMYC